MKGRNRRPEQGGLLYGNLIREKKPISFSSLRVCDPNTAEAIQEVQNIFATVSWILLAFKLSHWEEDSES